MPRVGKLTDDELRQLSIVSRHAAAIPTLPPTPSPIVVEPPAETRRKEIQAMLVRRGLDPTAHVIDEATGDINTKNGG